MRRGGVGAQRVPPLPGEGRARVTYHAGMSTTIAAVLALALVHHLAIGNNVPLDDVAALFERLGRYLILEFVPKADSQVQRLLTTREDVFPDYTREALEEGFARRFRIVRSESIEQSERTLYLMAPRA